MIEKNDLYRLMGTGATSRRCFVTLLVQTTTALTPSLTLTTGTITTGP